MHKVAVLGDKDSVYGFAALGLDVFYADDSQISVKVLSEIVSSQKYAVIYITESLAVSLNTEIEKFKFNPSISIILIPGVKGNTGEGMRSVEKCVEIAVGSGII